MLRALGRMLHIDDDERIAMYTRFVTGDAPVSIDALSERDRRLLRMLLASIVTSTSVSTPQDAMDLLWDHLQVRSELTELLVELDEQVDHVQPMLRESSAVPLHVHARYTRLEIQAAFNDGASVRPPRWDSGVKWLPNERTDIFAFTLDKTSGDFSPTTRYQDYAISPELIHWESQSTTSLASPTGQRYTTHRDRGTSVVLFARLRSDDRAFWCLGPATYVRHEGERPIAITWKLEHRLPANLFTAFAAAVA
jgi:hypothetical protein